MVGLVSLDLSGRRIHVVTKTMGENSLVYEVTPEDGRGRKRVLYRNLLFQCDFLPFEGPQQIFNNRIDFLAVR